MHGFARRCLTTLCLLSLPSAQDVRAADVTLTAEQMQRLEIKLEAARPAATEALAVLPGKIIRPLNSRLAVTASYSGTVTEIHVLPGQRIEKGAPLATISSRDLLEAQTSLAQAEADLQIAEAAARRKRMLADKNVQNPDVAAEAEAQVDKIKAVIDRHTREQALNGIVVKDGARFTIPALESGVVVEANVSPGDKVEAMGAVVTVDTSEDLWVDVQVPASVVALVRIGNSVRLEGGLEGRVTAIGGSLDESTRSAKLYAVLPRGSGLIPGQMITVTLEKESMSGALSVPADAVTRINDQPSVFVKTDAGFTVKPIELRGRSAEAATIAGDLSAGDQVASSGIPELEQMLSNE